MSNWEAFKSVSWCHFSGLCLPILSECTDQHLLWGNLLVAGDTKTRRLRWQPVCSLPLCLTKIEILLYSYPLPHMGRCHGENCSFSDVCLFCSY